MKFTPNSNKRQPIEFNGNIVGHIVDGVFEASRRGSKHKYLEMPDWLISMHILEHLDDVGIQDVRFIDLESKL